MNEGTVTISLERFKELEEAYKNVAGDKVAVFYNNFGISYKGRDEVIKDLVERNNHLTFELLEKTKDYAE